MSHGERAPNHDKLRPMTDNNTNDEEEPARDDLEQRVEQLEQTVQRMLPDRRQALRLGGTALAGGLLGVGATNSASAGSNQVGTIGSSGSLVDVEAEDVTAKSVDTDELNGGVTNSTSVSKIFGERVISASPVGTSVLRFSLGSTYDRYVLELADVTTSTDADNLWLQFKKGGTLQNGSSDYRYANEKVDDSGSTASAGQTSASKIVLTGGIGANVGNASGEGLTGQIKISNPSNSSLLQLVTYDFSFIDSGGRINHVRGGGAYNSAESVDAVQLSFKNGSISGDIDLYGLTT